jgi:predicted thioesterase
MKSTLQAGLTSTRRITIGEDRCIGFMGKVGMVYATPRMVLDVELTCRELLLEHLDDGEDSVGAHVSIDHLAATPLGLDVTIDVQLVDVDRRRATFEFSVRDTIEECGRGKHVRFIADKAKSFERIKAKRAKAGL